MENKNHVITRNNVEQKWQKSIQSDVVIPNELGNGETCQGLRHWRLISNLKNNFSRPVRNDMDNKNKLDCFASARNDRGRHPEGDNPKDLSTNVNFKPSPEFVSSSQLTNKFYPLTGREGKKNGKELINLSTYRLIDFKKVAFTLAETLITLAIIGIVAALTIPGLMTNYKKHKIETKLTKAVSTINQVIKQSEAENGEMETWDKSLPYEEFVKKYFVPYMKIMQICKPDNNNCGYGEDTAYTWSHLNGTYQLYRDPFAFGRTPFVSMDGILYAFAYDAKGTTVVSDNDKIILIDINGAEKPNKHGQDVFFLKRIEEDDSIIPYGADLPQATIMNNCNKNGNGMYCAALIRQNGWKIPKGYPLN